MANSHPGSYCGQDAYSDMLVIDNGLLRREWSARPAQNTTNGWCAELYARSTGGFNYRGGGGEPLEKPNNEEPVMPDGAKTVVRRLTPLECERLQGFPDGWTDIGEWVDTKGKLHKESVDSARYKALGNSIALPFWNVLARRICAMYDRDVTMGSLFDGIGGFPYAFEKCGAKAVWASEIEEFPIAVTKRRFPEVDT